MYNYFYFYLINYNEKEDCISTLYVILNG
jgi:hypothetical protein